jgi:hypothetical protein
VEITSSTTAGSSLSSCSTTPSSSRQGTTGSRGHPCKCPACPPVLVPDNPDSVSVPVLAVLSSLSCPRPPCPCMPAPLRSHSIFDGDGAQSIFHNAAAIAGLASADPDTDAKVRGASTRRRRSDAGAGAGAGECSAWPPAGGRSTVDSGRCACVHVCRGRRISISTYVSACAIIDVR